MSRSSPDLSAILGVGKGDHQDEPILLDTSDDEGTPGVTMDEDAHSGQPASSTPPPAATPSTSTPPVDKGKGRRLDSPSTGGRHKRGRSTAQPKAQSLADGKGPLRVSADFVSQLPAEARNQACELLQDCWSKSAPVQKVIRTLVEGKGSDTVEMYANITRSLREGAGAGGKCRMDELLPRLALLWVGSLVVAVAVYRNSHEDRAEGDGPQKTHHARRQQHQARTTEILLFGVRDKWRRFNLGTALVAYIRHLAMVHDSTRLMALYNLKTDSVVQFWESRLDRHSKASGGEEGTQVCTALFSLEDHHLGLDELGKRTTEATLGEFKAMMLVASKKVGCRPAVATQADGLEKDLLLGWFFKDDRYFYLAEYSGNEQLSGEVKHQFRFMDSPKKLSTIPKEPPRQKVWREAAAAHAAGLEWVEMYNWYYVVAAAPTEPAFEKQMAMQRWLPSQKDKPKQKAKPAKRASSSSETTSKPDTEREPLSFIALCAGTGMLPGVLANMGYKGIMVSRSDDGRGGTDDLLLHNWYWKKRPPAGKTYQQLEQLAATLHACGVGEGDKEERVRLWTKNTCEVHTVPSNRHLLSVASLHTVSRLWQIDPEALEAVTVVLLDSQCTTRSKNSAARHQRRGPDEERRTGLPDNKYCGITKECRVADIEFANQIRLLQWLQYKYPDVLIIIENPEDGIEKHPLTKKCVLARREQGGLGLMYDRFTNCFFPSVRDGGKIFNKPEALLHNCEPTHDAFRKDAMYCGPKNMCCRLMNGQNQGRHDQLHAKECSASAAFTYELATELARQINRGVSKRMGRECQHSQVPYADVRDVLLQAFKEADENKEKYPSAESYEERYIPCMEWAHKVEEIQSPPPVDVRPPTPTFLLAVMPPPSDDEDTDLGEDMEDEADFMSRLLLRHHAAAPAAAPAAAAPAVADELSGNDVDDAIDELAAREPRWHAAVTECEANTPARPAAAKKARKDGHWKAGQEVEAKLLLEAQRGRIIEVWWEGDKKWYAGAIIDWHWDWPDTKDAQIRHCVEYKIDGNRVWDCLMDGGISPVEWRRLD